MDLVLAYCQILQIKKTMRYIWISQNGTKLVPDREKLNQVIDKTPDDVPFTVTPWHENTPTKLMSSVAEYIIGNDAAVFVGVACLITKKPLHEALWDAFEKKLKDSN